MRTGDQRLRLLQSMIRIRRFEEKCVELYGLGKIRGFLHPYVGQEAIAVGVMEAIQPEKHDDVIVSNYREHGHALARGISMNAVMAEMFGKVTGCSRGRGGSMHLFDAQKRLVGGNAIVGGCIPLAVGMALADHMLNRSRIILCFFGDGAVAEGVFHESVNLASLWKLPVLFLCENNQYAMGTRLDRAHAQTDLCAKAAVHNVESETVDGMDVMAVIEATARASESVRSAGKPRFIEFITYRFRAHSMYDPDLYRTKAEIEEWKKRDPIKLLSQSLKTQQLLDESLFQQMEAAADAEIEASIEFAEASPWESVEDLLKDVYTPGTTGTKGTVPHEPAA